MRCIDVSFHPDRCLLRTIPRRSLCSRAQPPRLYHCRQEDRQLDDAVLSTHTILHRYRGARPFFRTNLLSKLTRGVALDSRAQPCIRRLRQVPRPAWGSYRVLWGALGSEERRPECAVHCANVSWRRFHGEWRRPPCVPNPKDEMSPLDLPRVPCVESEHLGHYRSRDYDSDYAWCV